MSGKEPIPVRVRSGRGNSPSDDMKDHTLDSTDLTWLSALARALLGEGQAAEDLVQDTAVAAIEGPMPPDAPKRAWLASVARRLAARRFRGDSRRNWRESEAARPEGLPDSAELVERAEVAEKVTAAAQKLPEPYRTAVLLRFLEGHDADEIARLEGKPVDTVRWRVRRGLALLREELVRRDGRDWSSWCVLLLPLARSNGGAGLATAGATGVVSGMVASMAVMNVKIAAAVALGCAGTWIVWNLDDPGFEDSTVAGAPLSEEVDRLDPVEKTKAHLASIGGGSQRRLGAETELDPEPAPTDLSGRVVDEAGAPVAGAIVYLVPRDRGGAPRDRGDSRARVQSDATGAFQFGPGPWEAEGLADGASLDLGAVANGFLRTAIPDVLAEASSGQLTVVLKRGQRLSGRVFDERGLPIPGLELLLFTPNARIEHVSPSQRALRSDQSRIADASSTYEQCRATSDGRGEVTFTGLPLGDLRVLSLDPGWTIVGPRDVEADGSHVLWTAKPVLGVRLTVVEAATGQPVELARATFCLHVTFADGEEMPLEQWVGRGSGEASFMFSPDLIPGLEKRTITRAEFYGKVRSGDGPRVDWRAEPLEDLEGVTGVAEVRVEVEGEDAPELPAATAPVGVAKLTLDVRYDDFAPFEGGLTVRWVVNGDQKTRDDDVAKATGSGQYEIEVPAGALSLEVEDRYASGSLPAWTAEVRCDPGETERLVVTLPRGASATITRPDGWSGEWFLHASWRPHGEEEWRGSWGHGTDAESLTLPALKPAEWRFQLRRNSAMDKDPLIRTVSLREGESAMVDG
jgi:RNA polymerase sigma-70 factor (ECF subfamily)